MELQGRTALVTGGSSDIGMATARALARRGADVVIHCNSGTDKAEGVRAEAEALGRRAPVIPADPTLHNETHHPARDAVAFQPIAILINKTRHTGPPLPW